MLDPCCDSVVTVIIVGEMAILDSDFIPFHIDEDSNGELFPFIEFIIFID